MSLEMAQIIFDIMSERKGWRKNNEEKKQCHKWFNLCIIEDQSIGSSDKKEWEHTHTQMCMQT